MFQLVSIQSLLKWITGRSDMYNKNINSPPAGNSLWASSVTCAYFRVTYLYSNSMSTLMHTGDIATIAASEWHQIFTLGFYSSIFYSSALQSNIAVGFSTIFLLDRAYKTLNNDSESKVKSLMRPLWFYKQSLETLKEQLGHWFSKKKVVYKSDDTWKQVFPHLSLSHGVCSADSSRRSLRWRACALVSENAPSGISSALSGWRYGRCTVRRETAKGKCDTLHPEIMKWKNRFSSAVSNGSLADRIVRARFLNSEDSQTLCWLKAF